MAYSVSSIKPACGKLINNLIVRKIKKWWNVRLSSKKEK